MAGTGRGGRITKEDVVAKAAAPATAVAVAAKPAAPAVVMNLGARPEQRQTEKGGGPTEPPQRKMKPTTDPGEAAGAGSPEPRSLRQKPQQEKLQNLLDKQANRQEPS